MLDRARLAFLPSDGGLALQRFVQGHRAALKVACAADRDVWAIYNVSWDPGHFDASFDALAANPAHLAFAILLDGKVIGMSVYLGID